jgi:hypothetical protein
MVRFSPSTNPIELKPRRNAATIGAKPAADAPLKKPTTDLAACCASRVEGTRAAIVVAPIPATQSRRRISALRLSG